MEGHEMYIIEMDGVEVDPYPIDAVTISVAQRYSVWVRALNQTDKNYAFMFMQDTDMQVFSFHPPLPPSPESTRLITYTLPSK